MKAKTGRRIEEWIEFVVRDGPADQSDRHSWRKSEHGLGTNYADWVAARSVEREADTDNPDVCLRHTLEYVEALYAGKRGQLRPLHDALIDLALAIGTDVKLCPCATFVPIFRNHVIAQINLASNARIDLGFALRDTTASGRLIDTGGYAKKDRITHRIAEMSIDGIDAETSESLRSAYTVDSP